MSLCCAGYSQHLGSFTLIFKLYDDNRLVDQTGLTKFRFLNNQGMEMNEHFYQKEGYLRLDGTCKELAEVLIIHGSDTMELKGFDSEACFDKLEFRKGAWTFWRYEESAEKYHQAKGYLPLWQQEDGKPPYSVAVANCELCEYYRKSRIGLISWDEFERRLEEKRKVLRK